MIERSGRTVDDRLKYLIDLNIIKEIYAVIYGAFMYQTAYWFY